MPDVLTLGASTSVDVAAAAPTKWENPYPGTVRVRLISDVAIHVRTVRKDGEDEAGLGDAYLPADREAVVQVDSDMDLSFVAHTGAANGFVSITTVR